MNMVGVWFDNTKTSNIDFENVNKGNPGCGGTSYLFALLIYSLTKQPFEMIVYSPKPIIGLSGFIWIKKAGINDAVNHFENHLEKSGTFICAAHFFILISNICLKKTKLALWHHNSVNINCQKAIDSSKLPITNIFLTNKQKYDYYLYSNIVKNSIIIPNANVSSYILRGPLQTKNVVYIGSIIPSKNLHLLLQAWPDVIKKQNAKLLVVGSGQVYDKSSVLGPKNIAEERYENQLMEIIEKNNISDSIKFLGIMNYKAFEENVAPITSVGVVNPAFKEFHYGETFCLSATQMGSFGIPVIGGDLWGLKSTIPRKCGYRIKNIKDLSNKIIKMLENKRTNIKYGKNYRRYIKKHYDVEIVNKKWVDFLSGKRIKNNNYLSIIPYRIEKRIKIIAFRLYNLIISNN